MKLHQQIVNEGHGPVPAVMILDEIIRDGKITNHVQLYTLARISEFFRLNHGRRSISLQMEDPVDFESRATSTAMIEALSAMSDADHAALAQHLKDAVAYGEAAVHCKQCDGHDPVEWIRFVLRRQD